jgi:hypothetical protein
MTLIFYYDTGGLVDMDRMTPWEQRLYETLCDALLQLHEVLATHPDMPTHAQTIADAETVLRHGVELLKENDLLPDDLRGVEI